jgi:GntR family transcriptional regulator
LKSPVNHNSPLPYYAQVKDVLRDWIKQGKWEQGAQLPGEHELCSIFDVSRPVIRQALSELTNEGIVTREKGRGTFVASPKIKQGLVQRLAGFFEDMTAQGYTPVTIVLAQEVVAASTEIAQHLRLNVGDSVIKVERLRFIDDEPIMLVTTFIPYHLCPQLAQEDLTYQSLYAFLDRSCNLAIAYGRRVVEAVAASKYVSDQLKIRKGSPLILLNSVSYMEDGTPVEYYYAYHRGDRSQFEVELVRVPDGASVLDVFGSQHSKPPAMMKLTKPPRD